MRPVSVIPVRLARVMHHTAVGLQLFDVPVDVCLRVADRSLSEGFDEDTLSEEEKTQLATFSNPGRRRCYTFGRHTMRTLVSERLAIGPEHVPLRVAPDGAPEVLQDGIHLSLAHTETPDRVVVAAAIAARPVGSDIEFIRPRREDLYRFMLAEKDYHLLELFPDHDLAQITLWTIKEAVLKARRSGFRTSPKKIDLALNADLGIGVANLPDGQSWAVRFGEESGCMVALAYAE